MRLTRAEITHKRQHAVERQRDFPHIHKLSPTHYYVTLNKLFNIFKTLSCPTLCDPMDYTVRGILQARILEWIASLFSRGSSQPRFSHCRQILYQLSHTREAQEYQNAQPIPSPADLPDPGIEPGSPALQVDSLPTELSGKPSNKLFNIFKTQFVSA